jgi:PAS domain S-box-containing protein
MPMEHVVNPLLADLTPILDTALDAVIVMRADGRIAAWNDVAEKTFGWSSEEAVDRQLSELIIPHRYRDAHHTGLATYLETGKGPVLNHRIEISGLRSSGEEFPVELSITPTNISGEQIFLGFLRDISERKAAEAALRESEARLAATYNHALVGIAEINRNGCILRANDQYLTMTGYTFAELRTKSVFDISHEADRDVDRQLFDEQWSGAREGYTLEKRYVRKDGSIIWVELAASIVRSGGESEPYGVRILRDISDKKRAEEQQRLLLHELNHRVKNTLAVVQGLAHQTFRTSAVPMDLRKSFEGRLGALAAAHNLLMQQTWDPTPIKGAAEAALRPFQTIDGRISVDGPELLVPPAATISLTLVLHELATNAAKYGALSDNSGTVDVTWAVDMETLTLVWRERGGPPVVKPDKSGFGTKLLERVVAGDFGGQFSIAFDVGGVLATITMPLARITAFA